MDAVADIACERARATDEADVIHLLRACGLPTADLVSGLPHFFVARSGAALVGCVGIELFGRSALLRSLAVTPAWRGRGLARRLWQVARRDAIDAGAEDIFLLTTTAEPLFLRWGFERSSRDAAPAEIRASREFSSLCPSSATFMRIAAR